MRLGSAEPEGDPGQPLNLLMQQMEFIVLDTRRKCGLKVTEQSHIGLKLYRNFEPKREQAGPGSLYLVFQRQVSVIQLNANGFPCGLSVHSIYSATEPTGCVRVLFLISMGGIGL